MIAAPARHPRPSSLRRLRKRYRRKLAEATAGGPTLRGGWGTGSEIRPRDLLLIRQAIREGWETPPEVCEAIINDVICPALDAHKPRLTIATVRCVIDMMKSHQGGFDALRRRLARQRASR